ncbi:DHA1 family bicyclomycin/chloramphenicol resistance-like MFS transporter [Stella humosa]|uniref:Bcr/CflA family efflux transporter n=1 Tax=Stella humosa TaxID=94 RepID=A0A3N1LGB0_9PROT|nr:multidrug effflux MFS transporter [Stella humosa]ROP90527.1 DHA1 family bicyclomycin/chloramphenicol resistance-like MFS transporter [Stella humosa]BBK29578.1 Bcr/CflA family drug resistance efflux transporter [Stella humosa]
MLRAGSPSALVLLVALATMTSISIAIYLPAMPTLAADLGTSMELVQLTVSIFLVGVGLGQLVYGPASDRFGRRPALLFGLVVYGAGSLACALAPTIGVLLAGRALQAAGACAGMALVRAIIRDTYPRERMAGALSTVTGAMAISPALAPILGSQIYLAFGWRADFLFLAGFAVFLLVLAVTMLPETNHHRDPLAMQPARLLANYRSLLANRTFVGHMLAGGLALSGAFAYTVASPFILIERLGVRPDLFALLMISTTLAYVTGTWTAPRLARRIGLERALRVGGGICAAAALVMVAVAVSGVVTILTVVAGMTFYMVGMGMTLPLSMAGGIGPFPRMAGAASALIGAGQMVTGSLASAASAGLAGWGMAGLATVVVGTGGGALAAALFLVRAPDDAA